MVTTCNFKAITGSVGGPFREEKIYWRDLSILNPEGVLLTK